MESKVFEVIKTRSSVRDYSDRPIEDEKLKLVLEAARLAPSASNSQPWHFYIVKNKEKISELGGKMPLGSETIINGFLAQAPVVVAATAGPIDLFHKVMGAIVNKKWYFVDVGIALEHMALTAWDLGIGSCWIGWFDEKRVKKVLNISEKEDVIALLTLGYPREGFSLRTKIRKELDEIVKVIL